MSATKVNWLGKPTLVSAVRSAVSRSAKDRYSLLKSIAEGTNVPDGCDPRFVEIAKFLVNEDKPDPSCHPDFSRTWKFFQPLAKGVCDEMSLHELSKARHRAHLKRMIKIASWRSSLEEVWKLPPYEKAKLAGDFSPATLQIVGGNEARAIWLVDEQTEKFLSIGKPPAQVPKSYGKGGSYAQQVVICGLSQIVHHNLRNVTCEADDFILSVCEWIGNADDWPNFNMHAPFFWMSQLLSLGDAYEKADLDKRIRAAFAWPEVARVLGQELIQVNDRWPNRTQYSWCEGVILRAKNELTDDTESCAKLYGDSDCPITRKAVWQKFSAVSVNRPTPSNPFETARFHPFVDYLDTEIIEPRMPTISECRNFVESQQ